ncbi:hypothetical protein HYZ64_04005 [Candidatus Berkelbacteria bacterium]|nr:hypothetical protein [Candidatus Berkelbacteria bacterium]
MEQDRAKLIIAVLGLALFIGVVAIIYQEQKTLADQGDLDLLEIYNPHAAQQSR